MSAPNAIFNLKVHLCAKLEIMAHHRSLTQHTPTPVWVVHAFWFLWNLAYGLVPKVPYCWTSNDQVVKIKFLKCTLIFCCTFTAHLLQEFSVTFFLFSNSNHVVLGPVHCSANIYDTAIFALQNGKFSRLG